MVDTHLIVHVASDSLDNFIFTIAIIAVIMAVFSSGVSIVFLIDYFKRHGWQYKHRVKKNVEQT
jgi:hypothetical protein